MAEAAAAGALTCVAGKHASSNPYQLPRRLLPSWPETTTLPSPTTIKVVFSLSSRRPALISVPVSVLLVCATSPCAVTMSAQNLQQHPAVRTAQDKANYYLHQLDKEVSLCARSCCSCLTILRARDT